ncbi:potassium/proton antiporter [Vibrio sp.]|nr:potassium/proton antiporter [Vibrio sp.]
MTVDFINGLFLVGALLILTSIVISPLSSRLGVPILVVFLGVGMMAGEDGPGKIFFDDYTVAYIVSNLALAVILIDGGMRTKMSSFKIALWPSVSLATIGVAVTTALTGMMASYLFHLSWLEGLLIGAIVGSTDASAVFSLLKGKQINQRVGSTLEIESGTNDPMAVFLTVTLIAILASQSIELDGKDLSIQFIQQFGVGGILGIGGGFILRNIINKATLPEGLYSILAVSGGLSIFSLSNTLGGSGILSIYVVGLILGNKPTRSKHSILNVLDGMTWLSQIIMFIVLGLLATPSDLIPIALPAIMLAAFMIVIARPIAVWLCLTPFKSFKAREKWFISWVGLRGAVPIILAVFPMMAGLEHARLFFNIAFFVVLVSLIVQGGTLPKALKIAKVELPPKPHPILRTGLELYPGSAWEMLVYQLKSGRWYIGAPLRNLIMPENTRIAAIYRGQTLLHPSGSTKLEADDIVCVIAEENAMDELSKLFTESPQQQSIRRFFGDFFIDVNTKISDISLYYGLDLGDNPDDMTLKQLVDEQLGTSPVLGDMFEWQGLSWIIADSVDWNVKTVGLRLPDEETLEENETNEKDS